MKNETDPINQTLETTTASTLHTSPVDRFIQFWRVFEKMVVSLSLAIVLGTIGYVSLHHLI